MKVGIPACLMGSLEQGQHREAGFVVERSPYPRGSWRPLTKGLGCTARERTTVKPRALCLSGKPAVLVNPVFRGLQLPLPCLGQVFSLGSSLIHLVVSAGPLCSSQLAGGLQMRWASVRPGGDPRAGGEGAGRGTLRERKQKTSPSYYTEVGISKVVLVLLSGKF